ncbi:hypothetical protein CCR75_009767 [Bremia lactucae]|uniref:Uncharacterized protein n=1 Tax=Bremia lactucae TaxID=4779 RepID=A0A976IDG9_BRELC|nr:hypothetical protein CCR75_009767 [Bremia lactucae]
MRSHVFMKLLINAIGAYSVLSLSNKRLLGPEDGALFRSVADNEASGTVHASGDVFATSPFESNATTTDERTTLSIESLAFSFHEFWKSYEGDLKLYRRLQHWLVSTDFYTQLSKQNHVEDMKVFYDFFLQHLKAPDKVAEMISHLLKVISQQNTKNIMVQVLLRMISIADAKDHAIIVIIENLDAFLRTLHQIDLALPVRSNLLIHLLPSVTKWMPARFQPLPSDFFETAVLEYNILYYVKQYIMTEDELNQWFIDAYNIVAIQDTVKKLQAAYARDDRNSFLLLERMHSTTYLTLLSNGNVNSLDPPSLLQWLRYCNIYLPSLSSSKRGLEVEANVLTKVETVVNEISLNVPANLYSSLERIIDMKSFISKTTDLAYRKRRFIVE